jgi:hypothetical membrane protein
VKAPAQTEARRESRAIVAAWASFGAGLAFGLIALSGEPRAIAGDDGIAEPAAGIAAIVTATAFVLSALLHRRAETAPMPAWQTAVSHISTAAITVAFGAVAYVGVLTGGEVLAIGLQGLEAPPIGGALLTAVACAAGGWLAFRAGVELSTRDLANLLFAYLTIGTVFAMITAADPTWWQHHFSDLGAGDGAGAWAFNGTVVVAGLLVATVGSYIGRDLHRWLGDAALPRIGAVVALFALTGAALAGVGIFPLHLAPLAHDIAAFGTLGLFALTALVVTVVLPGPPLAMLLTTIGAGVALVVAVLLWQPFAVYSAAGLEAVAVGVMFVWMTTLVRTLSAFAPDASRPSSVRSLRAHAAAGA